jgi:F-type H+-transporting ATPase subunit b
MAGDTNLGGAGDDLAKAAGSAFPPFDASLFSSQIFWFWLSFGVLYIVLAGVVIPRIGQTLARRQGFIDTDLKAAAEQTALAQAARLKAEKAASDARAQARKTVEDMRLVNDAAAAKAEAEAASALTSKIAEAEARIALAHGAALASISDTIGELAAMIVERVSGTKPTAKAVSAALSGQPVAGAA